MRKLFLFFFVFCFVGLSVTGNLTAGIVVADGDEDNVVDLTENDVVKISRASVRVRPGLTKADGVEYFGPAHKDALLNSAKEAGFTTIEAQGLVDVAVIEKRTLKGKGPQALENFYAKLDKKRAECGTSLTTLKSDILAEVDRKIAEAKKAGLVEGAQALEAMKANLEKQIADAKAAGLAEGLAYVDKVASDKTAEFNKVLDDPTTGLSATYQLAKATSDRLDDMDRAWGGAIEKTHADITATREGINKVDQKVHLVDAKVHYLGGRAKLNKDKNTGSNVLSYPIQVGNKIVNINEEILPAEKKPEEKKDSAPAGKKSGECK